MGLFDIFKKKENNQPKAKQNSAINEAENLAKDIQKTESTTEPFKTETILPRKEAELSSKKEKVATTAAPESKIEISNLFSKSIFLLMIHL